MYWAAHETSGVNMTTFPTILTYAQNMISGIRSMTEEIFIEVFVGFWNGDFYSIGDCRSSTQNCTNPGYNLFFRNAALIGNNSLVTIHLNLDGNVDSDQKIGDIFPTTERPWFVIQNGWTSTYTSTTTGWTVRAYSQAFKYGIAAGEVQLSSTGDCYLGRNGQYSSGYKGFISFVRNGFPWKIFGN